MPGVETSVLRLDVQACALQSEADAPIPLTPDEAAALYWISLDAPVERVARALRKSAEDTAALCQSLRARFDLSDRSLTLQFATGHGPASAVPWADRTALALFRMAMDRDPDSPLVYVSEEGALSVGDVKYLVGQAIGALTAEGIGPADRFAVDSTQRLESFILTLAGMVMGALVIRIGDGLGAKTLTDQVETARPKLMASAHFGQLSPDLATGNRIGFDAAPADIAFEDWLHAAPPPPENWLEAAQVRPDQGAVVGFTSGSTGRPKAIIVTHETIYRTTEAATALLALQPDDVFCSATDYTALCGFRSLFGLPFLCGGRILLPSETARHQPLALALECERYGVTRLTAVATNLRVLARALDRIGPDGLRGVRTLLSGCGVTDPVSAAQLETAYGLDVVDYYGAREIATVLYSRPGETSTLNDAGGFASQALLRVLNDAGEPCAPGETGELFVHSDTAMLGRLQEDGSIEEDPSPWYASGDLCEVTAEGRVIYTGRKKDIIKARDGSLLAPLEIENFVQLRPEIEEACAFAGTGADGVEQVELALRLSAGLTEAAEDEIRTGIQTELGPQFVPGRIHIVTDFPRVGRGKIDKPKLRASLVGAGTRPVEPAP